MISEDALITMRAQFLRFSSLFDTDQSRDVIRSAVAEVTKPMLEEWINKNMPTIARDVITEAISQIAEFRPEK
jgi:cell pole-organizing protein PopZ